MFKLAFFTTDKQYLKENKGDYQKTALKREGVYLTNRIKRFNFDKNKTFDKKFLLNIFLRYRILPLYKIYYIFKHGKIQRYVYVGN